MRQLESFQSSPFLCNPSAFGHFLSPPVLTSISRCAAEQSSNPVAAATTGDVPPKEPVAEAQTSTKTADPATAEVTQPLPVVPETHKAAGTSATDTNGTASGVNGTGDSFKPVVPEESKQSSAPSADASVDRPVASDGAPATSDAHEPTNDSAQPPVMTGALPLGDQPKQASASTDPVESAQEDGVKDLPATTTKTTEPSVNGDDKKDGATSDEVAPDAAADEKKDVDMKDVAPVEADSSIQPKDVDMKNAVPATVPVSDATGAPSISGTVSAADGEEVTGEKRKAETEANGIAADEEPAEKKHKGLAGKVASKAKEVVDEVKEKATPGRKNSKKGKREQAPVGRTERKTRSQGSAD